MCHTRIAGGKVAEGKQNTALILDEMQRCPVEAFCALGSRHDAVVAVGDRGQEIHPTLPSGEAAVLPAPKFVLQAGPTFASEPLLERAMAAPGAPGSPKVYHLTASKRFGAPLAAYLARAHPDLCAALTASPSLGKTTPVVHVWYTACCLSWYNMGYFLASARKRPLRGTAAWQLSAATWHDGLFSMVAAYALARRGDVGS